jgi:ankyrin repeat protein
MKRRAALATAFLACAVASESVHAGDEVDFFRAVRTDRVNVVRALLVGGFNVNAQSEQKQIALYVALQEESSAVASLLLDWPGALLDAPNASGETPLMMASLKGNRPAVESLLAKGAAVNRAGWTPLHYAAAGAQIDIMALLLARGAALEAAAPNGNTALMMAAGFGGIDAADWLLKRGANPTARNAAGRSAADLARSAGWDALAARLDRASQGEGGR